MIRALLLTIALVCAAGCEPAEDPFHRTLRVNVENDYAESIFTVGYDFTLDSGKPVSGPLLTEKRLGYGQSAYGEERIPYETERLKLLFSALSLGEVQGFEPIEIDMTKADGSSQYTIRYRYDIARATFGIQHGWESCFGCSAAEPVAVEAALERPRDLCANGCQEEPPHEVTCPGWDVRHDDSPCLTEWFGSHVRYGYCEVTGADPCASVWYYYVSATTGQCTGYEQVMGEPITSCFFPP